MKYAFENKLYKKLSKLKAPSGQVDRIKTKRAQLQRKVNELPNIVEAENNFQLTVNKLHEQFTRSFELFAKAYNAALW